MIKDIKRYFSGDETEYYANQQLIGIKALFRGVIVKEWVAVNNDNMNYHEYNRILVKSCMQFYHNCWKERCEELHKDNMQKEILEEEIKNMKEEANNGIIKGLRNYVDAHKIDEKEEKISTMKAWRTGFRSFIKNAPKIVHKSISGWFKKKPKQTQTSFVQLVDNFFLYEQIL